MVTLPAGRPNVHVIQRRTSASQVMPNEQHILGTKHKLTAKLLIEDTHNQTYKYPRPNIGLYKKEKNHDISAILILQRLYALPKKKGVNCKHQGPTTKYASSYSTKLWKAEKPPVDQAREVPKKNGSE